MVKKWLIIDTTGLLATILLFLFLASCTPQKRLDRLIKNHPELSKEDTVYTTRGIDIPGFHLDTTFEASTDVSGLYSIIDHYKDCIDSLNRTRLTTEIKNYITTRKCLEDTFNVRLDNNGFCKIWQSKEVFHYQLSQPKRKMNISVPISVPKFETTTKYNWVMFWGGTAASFGFLVILFLLKSWFKP